MRFQVAGRRPVGAIAAHLTAAALVVVTLTACTLQGTKPSTGGDGAIPASAVSYDAGASTTVSGSSGDRLTVQMSVGPGKAAADVPEAQPCIPAFPSSSDLLTLPVRVTLTLTASSPAPLTLDLQTIRMAAAGGSQPLFSGQFRWSVRYSDTPQQCKGDMGGALVSWHQVSPGTAATAIAWLVMPKIRDSLDSNGSDTLGRLLIVPTVSVRGAVSVVQFPSSSSHVLACTGDDPAAGPGAFFAVDPGTARTHGCGGTGQASDPGADAVCMARYPAVIQNQKKVGNATVYNRAQTMYQICTGFGDIAPAMTPAMACAIVGLTADESSGLGDVKHLCETSDVQQALHDGNWLSLAIKNSCQYIGSAFADVVGVAAAGGTSELGPMAAAVGVGTRDAFVAGAHLVCDGDFRDAVSAFGGWLEQHYEAALVKRVVKDHNLCLSNDPTSTLKPWNVARCP